MIRMPILPAAPDTTALIIGHSIKIFTAEFTEIQSKHGGKKFDFNFFRTGLLVLDQPVIL
jgi:hypothetical protein